MMKMPLPRLLAGTLVAWIAAVCPAADLLPNARPSEAQTGVRAELRPDQSVVQAGRPVWVTFILTNLTAEPVVLKVPNATTAKESAPAEIALPLSHVFSGVHFSAVSIHDSHADEWDKDISVTPRAGVPSIKLAPHGSIGLRLDLTEHYGSLKRPGKYKLVWRPYGATYESAPLEITLLAERQAIILTEYGSITMRFYYNEAPMAVQNFIELADLRFYDNLTFHKVLAQRLVWGGDPLGDGRGVRTDGKRLKAEFSDIPFEAGTVGMCRLARDPDSASCQFFICVSRQPSFDGNQTAFARLVGEHSFETLRKITAVPTNNRNHPLRPVLIRTITLENVPGALELGVARTGGRGSVAGSSG